ncbi:GNAT family N-acetyltransferase [Nocardiopsis gilva YIM 90087]|uniref:GNAT family N-acetyltransferase n=1 Tax=Nocardiopsis gilva YIM 90087 TaxID=1235441 RepID=A0A223S6X4_9ACTN|nr:GNAT family N-acetyltransferase [Nocardiopsis gilva]ASU83863.1 GNAT family N-acetyltransferase [Nocardiopsis gilva YIM 90087]
MVDGRPGGAPDGITVRPVLITDPLAAPMIAELTAEYCRRYGEENGRNEMNSIPDSDFAPPHGGVLLLEEDGEIIAGGAFRRWEHDLPGARATSAGTGATVEFKRVWTASAHRRRGLARRVMAELEAAARRTGYRTAFLITGPAQPEAIALYTRLGYTRLDPADTPGVIYPDCVPFIRSLVEDGEEAAP